MLHQRTLLKSLPLQLKLWGALLVLSAPQIFSMPGVVAQSVSGQSPSVQSPSTQNVLAKVAKTGVLTAGTSKDAFPLAYTDKNGQLTGYSVEMIQLIKARLEKELKRPITLKLVALSPAERLAKIQSGEVDLTCDTSSFTWERDKSVDFSVSYGTTGTHILTKKGTALDGPETLVGKRIGVLAKTTNELAIRRVQPKAQVVSFTSREEGFKALQAGKIDGFAGDTLVLTGWVQKMGAGQTFEVGGYAYSTEGIACMVPENNSKLLDAVNYSLIRFMQGFLSGKPKDVAIFDRTFGPNGAIPLTQDARELVKENLQFIVNLREVVPDGEF